MQGQPSMQDNLRLQRLVQHLSTLVDGFLEQSSEEQEAKAIGPEDAQSRHEEIMHIAEAVFKEMSLQVCLLQAWTHLPAIDMHDCLCCKHSTRHVYIDPCAARRLFWPQTPAHFHELTMNPSQGKPIHTMLTSLQFIDGLHATRQQCTSACLS